MTAPGILLHALFLYAWSCTGREDTISCSIKHYEEGIESTESRPKKKGVTACAQSESMMATIRCTCREQRRSGVINSISARHYPRKAVVLLTSSSTSLSLCVCVFLLEAIEWMVQISFLNASFFCYSPCAKPDDKGSGCLLLQLLIFFLFSFSHSLPHHYKIAYKFLISKSLKFYSVFARYSIEPGSIFSFYQLHHKVTTIRFLY